MIHGFGISGFRSFGATPQFVAPMGKINVLVGQNNSGKSNVIRALILTQQFASNDPKAVEFNLDLDSHHGTQEAESRVYFPIPLDEAGLAAYVERVLPDANEKHFGAARRIATKVLQSLPERHYDYAWYGYRLLDRRRIATPTSEILGYATRKRPQPPIVQDSEWTNLWGPLTNQGGGDLLTSHIPQTLEKLSPLNWHPKLAVHLIGAHRRIGVPDSSYEGLSGQGLIKRLAELQTPVFAKRSEREKFSRINEFVRDVTGARHARLQIPHSMDEIQVDLDGKLLPIESLGTGIHQVVIFAASATAVDGAIVCIEEPEIHLHPRLQKKLIAYLSANTSNQYLIASHSAHFLDTPDASVFHVQLNAAGETEIAPVRSPNDQASICWDLGYRASDLVQANCIVWVEGPSDRIYLNEWLAKIAPDLKEGTAYSIMFYGGRLLSHLSAEDVEIDSFIALKRLNRNVAILIDSDRASATSPISATKMRVSREVAENGGFAWITAGREIENYVPASVMQQALHGMYPDRKFPVPSQFGCPYKPTSRPVNFQIDKVRLARAVRAGLDLETYDLATRLDELVRIIRSVNG